MKNESTKRLINKLLTITSNCQKALSQLEKDPAMTAKLKRELDMAKAEVEIHDVAAGLGCVNPALLYQCLETDIDVKDFDGDIDIRFIDKTTGKPRIDPRTGKAYTVHGRIAEARYSPDTSLLFTDGKPSSSSSPKIRNPWRKASFNLTEQARITRDNPSLAARLKAEANDE
jgi:hypothetical protein